MPVSPAPGYATGIDLYALLDAADIAERKLMMPFLPLPQQASLAVSRGVFSGFQPKVAANAEEFGVDAREVFLELDGTK